MKAEEHYINRYLPFDNQIFFIKLYNNTTWSQLYRIGESVLRINFAVVD